jgi:NAD(P)-dependent dehydrogenase (short-subunit alcohol dehydrogenase family)
MYSVSEGIINFEDINSENAYDHKKSYTQSKLANILFSRELAKRVQGMLCSCGKKKRYGFI